MKRRSTTTASACLHMWSSGNVVCQQNSCLHMWSNGNVAHAYICGPMDMPSLNESRSIFVDDLNCFGVVGVHFLKKKDIMRKRWRCIPIFFFLKSQLIWSSGIIFKPNPALFKYYYSWTQPTGV